MSESITVVGKGASWKECAFNTPEIWGTATCLCVPELRDKPFTKVFAFDIPNSFLNEAFAVAKERNIEIVSTTDYSYRTEDYPLIPIVKEFGVAYFRNTASYMLAMAIYQNPKTMYVYGLEQNETLNYVLFRPWVTFWFGVAYGRKIRMKFGRGVLEWQYKSLPLHDFLNKEEIADLSIQLGYKDGQLVI